jgi:glycosyltransferase involved in cell wall biosynthesis
MRSQLYMLREALTNRRMAAESLRDFRLPADESSWVDRKWAAIDWLCAAQDACRATGLSYGYHLERGWQAPYPETTGYAIPTLLACAQDGMDWLDRRRAIERRCLDLASWLVSIQQKSGSITSGTTSHVGPPTVFNTAQVLDGLAAAARHFSDTRIADAALAAGRWLLSVQDDDGCWRRGLSGLTVQTPASYNVRSAAALFRAGQLLDEPTFTAAAIRNADWVLSQQRENGWFENNCVLDNDQPLTHTIGYTLEGLLDLAISTGNERWLASVQTASRHLWPLVGSGGWLSGRFDARWRPRASWVCLTGSSQLAAVWYRLARLTGESAAASAADAAIGFVCRTQRMKPRFANDPTVGGIRGSYPAWGRYEPYAYPNWAPKFFLDALIAQRDLRSTTICERAPIHVSTPEGRPLEALKLEYVVELMPAWLMAEISAMRTLGATVTLVAAFRPPREPEPDPERQALFDECLYFPPDYAGVFGANIRALVSSPLNYLGAWWELRRRGEAVRFLVLAAYLLDENRRRGVNHVHGMFGTRTATLARVISRLSGVPYSFSTHAYDLFNKNATLAWKTSHAAFMRTISRFNARFLGDEYPRLDLAKVKVVRLGVNLERFAPAPDPGAPRIEVICVGSLLRHKGQQVLLQASAELTKAGVDHHVTIIGVGPTRGMLEELARTLDVRRHVTFVPACAHEEMARRFASSHVCVLPCLDMRREGEHVDGIPVVLMEAMAMGIPVISTPVSGIPELIEDKVSGLLVPQADPAALAAALRDLAANPDRRVALGAGARARILDRFNLLSNTRSLGTLMLEHAAPAPVQD